MNRQLRSAIGTEFANALRDAFAASGAWFNETPLTPARVRAVLDRAGLE